VRRLLLQVLELGVGEEDEVGGLDAIEGEEACGVDLVPQFKHADGVAEAELTLTRILRLQLIKTAACWKANPRVRFQAVFRAKYWAKFLSNAETKLAKDYS